jgi:hypothetical protein
MNKENYIWENQEFRKNPYRVPDEYFASFPDRIMDRIMDEQIDESVNYKRLLKPWMAWASSIAAVLIIGWFGVRSFYWKPLQEVRLQEQIALVVDYYGNELNEGRLAGYLIDNNIEVHNTTESEVNALIQMEPDLAEEFIFESVGF